MWGIQDLNMLLRKQVLRRAEDFDSALQVQIMLEKSEYSAAIQARYKVCLKTSWSAVNKNQGNKDEIPELIRQATGTVPTEENGEKKGINQQQ